MRLDYQEYLLYFSAVRRDQCKNGSMTECPLSDKKDEELSNQVHSVIRRIENSAIRISV